MAEERGVVVRVVYDLQQVLQLLLGHLLPLRLVQGVRVVRLPLDLQMQE
jgi:hypothetical protein